MCAEAYTLPRATVGHTLLCGFLQALARCMAGWLRGIVWSFGRQAFLGDGAKRGV